MSKILSSALFLRTDIKKLDDDHKAVCEGLLTTEECYSALKGFQKNKSPGTDGLTADFYRFFWAKLGKIMVDSFNFGFGKGELSISQKQGIIRLIPKKKQKFIISQNWRPISLLNVDYKIATKALALRLGKVLPKIIDKVQTGYLKGRFIGENIRLISDILDYTAGKNIGGIALFIDFEKLLTVLNGTFCIRR